MAHGPALGNPTTLRLTPLSAADSASLIANLIPDAAPDDERVATLAARGGIVTACAGRGPFGNPSGSVAACAADRCFGALGALEPRSASVGASGPGPAAA